MSGAPAGGVKLRARAIASQRAACALERVAHSAHTGASENITNLASETGALPSFLAGGVGDPQNMTTSNERLPHSRPPNTAASMRRA